MRMATVMEMASSTCPMAVETATEIRRSTMKGFQNWGTNRTDRGLVVEEVVSKLANLLEVLLPQRVGPLPLDLVEAVLAPPPVTELPDYRIHS